MTVTLPLKEMSRSEKLRVMEDVWSDLAATEEDLPSPEWHEAVLQETEQLVATGAAKFSDWDLA